MALPGNLSGSLFQLVTVVQAPGLCEVGVGDGVGSCADQEPAAA